MSLTVRENGESKFAPIAEGTHLGVCSMLVDLGMQFNEAYQKSSRKVLIGWELPDEQIEIDGEQKPRTISQRYTMSLNERSTLRRDLAAWRGRDFTAEELAGFDLQNIVGKSCLINVIHRDYNGKTYANIQNIMALPRGMAKGQLTEEPQIFDLDKAPLEAVDKLPGWIAEIIKKSETYQERLAAEVAEVPGKPAFAEISDEDGELPF
jgi:hypothetical protein